MVACIAGVHIAKSTQRERILKTVVKCKKKRSSRGGGGNKNESFPPLTLFPLFFCSPLPTSSQFLLTPGARSFAYSLVSPQQTLESPRDRGRAGRIRKPCSLPFATLSRIASTSAFLIPTVHSWLLPLDMP